MKHEDIINAHVFSADNRERLKADKKCGCFYCLKIFGTGEITRWLGGNTAVCPYCGIDSVIGESCGFLTAECLSAMKDYWFK